MKRKWYIGLLVGMVMLSCSPHELREARDVVTQADSLRVEGKMYGVDMGDSVSLAQAYETLQSWRVCCPTDFAHACYHYGRLLREKENPVEAMQVFINATHSHTRDYAILGRIYNNMGDISHLACEYPLSCDMFKQSAEMYLRNGDTIAYHYVLSDIAFEVAEQAKTEETLALIQEIIDYGDSNLYKSTFLPQAKLYLKTEQYNSLLQVCEYLPGNYAINYVFKALAFEHLNKKDSSLHYAKQVLTLPDASEQDKYNMLYILMNNDSTLQYEDLIVLSAQRSDIETDVLIPLHNQWALAVQILEQDINQKPNLTWLYAILSTLVIVCISIIIYVYRKRQRQQLLTQKIEVLEHTATTMQKNNDNLKEQQDRRYAERLKQIQANSEWFVKSNDIRFLLQKGNYKEVCELINTHFFMLADKLKMAGRLNDKDVCLCIFVINDTLTDKQIADIFYYSHNSIRSNKRYVAKKIGTTGAHLQSFLLEKAIE